MVVTGAGVYRSQLPVSQSSSVSAKTVYIIYAHASCGFSVTPVPLTSARAVVDLTTWKLESYQTRPGTSDDAAWQRSDIYATKARTKQHPVTYIYICLGSDFMTRIILTVVCTWYQKWCILYACRSHVLGVCRSFRGIVLLWCPAVIGLSLLRRMDMGSLTCAHTWFDKLCFALI